MARGHVSGGAGPAGCHAPGLRDLPIHLQGGCMAGGEAAAVVGR